MLINRTGIYGRNGYEKAEVFGLPGTNCIDYIVQWLQKGRCVELRRR